MHDKSPLSYEHLYIDPSIRNDQGLAARFPFPTLADPATVHLSVVVPAYNEELRLPKMMNETLSVLIDRVNRDPQFKFEIIVVDDGSKDRTTEVALGYTQRFGANIVRVLTLPQNQGKGGAVQQGVLHARGRLILFADADGASDFTMLTKLEEALMKIRIGEHGIAIGSRAHLEEESVAKRKWYRTVLMVGFHVLVSMLAGVSGIRDTQCGFKLFTRETARLLFSNQHVRRWCFDVELLYIAQQQGIPIAEVPIAWQEIAGSKLEIFDASFQMARDVAITRLSYVLGIWQIQDPDSPTLKAIADKARKSALYCTDAHGLTKTVGGVPTLTGTGVRPAPITSGGGADPVLSAMATQNLYKRAKANLTRVQAEEIVGSKSPLSVTRPPSRGIARR